MRMNTYLMAVLALVWAVAGTGYGQHPSGGGMAGKVVETMDSGGYTYVKAEVETGTVWAATTKFPVKIGDTVVIPAGGMPMKNFASPTLGKTFDSIHFVGSIQVGSAGHAAAATPPVAMPPHGAMGGAGAAMPSSHPPMHKGRPTSTVAEEVGVITPPENGLQVADLFKDRNELAGKPVTVRGRVVKFTPRVMDKNWIHLQDGSGSVGAGTHDLTLTTDQTAAVGDLVTVTGVVAIDRDFGYGYAYPLLVEEAKLEVESP